MFLPFFKNFFSLFLFACFAFRFWFFFFSQKTVEKLFYLSPASCLLLLYVVLCSVPCLIDKQATDDAETKAVNICPPHF